ncbi:hypothetical protein ABFS82_06G074600 [Erythranthe guttata]|uniref:PUM-HD domain-containing protein n=1 Tax=Erythranthe guttata TaxID=4155 RepID=A0A022PWR9_ERYGU|nr:PREDICTED: pumilio homolog 1-like [Erythranthe guttata]EYU19929.1 hypothetical protein MIMGU_mgv1a001211mg [Erythranthe guttata]|eukprot:XP_012858454.1 PREDICTED: pumilio homolog 1-like [Erythranthe guttata]
MITESYSEMISEMGVRSVLGRESSNNYNEELGRLLRERATEQEASDRDRELSLLRSGSAPPIVQRSLSSGFLGGNVSEEELRSDPAYSSYYYQNVNMNPRLPPPLLLKEDWRSGWHLQGPSAARGGSAIGDRRKISRGGDGASGGGGGESLFSMQPDLGGSKEEHVMQAKEWSGDGLIGLPGLGLGTHRKSIADMVQDDIGNATSISRHSVPQNYASAMGASLSRNNTPDPHAVGRSPSPRIPSASVASDLVASLSGLSLSIDSLADERKHPKNEIDAAQHNLSHFPRNKNPVKQHPYLNENSNGPSTPPAQYLNFSSPTSSLSNYGLGGYPASPLMLGNQVQPLVESMNSHGSRALSGGGGLTHGVNLLAAAQEDAAFPMGLMDPSYLQYLRSNEYSLNRESLVANSQGEFLALQKAYVEALLQKSQYGLAYGKSSNLSNGFHGNSGYGVGFSYSGNPMGRPVYPNSPVGSGGPARHMEQMMHFPSSLRTVPGNFVGQWPSEIGLDENFAASLLDEFKGNKTRCFELAEIAGHVVEFSADQYGSRFIQQKLETASTQEKNMVFHEIMPQALSLMTDVFGNYVIQKFFEHGSASQIRQLAEQLIGHVLTLSLQMYGCRVIQKAIEVIELDQQTKMVAELDGHVMRCVRDQNGNHVIQKCIERVPEAAIQFIVTIFYDQVVTLSTHPYGCRVIQRVLEHCHSPKTQSIVMNEIMKSVILLAQDQYGNYVIQHVLEHGNPHERSAIISQLTGKIVEMSQQKFASNVIEKCLSFGTAEERQTLVFEMLGTTDENEPLQVMMKDQFANYVVQKVLETCDDQQLELLLNRIKVHLNALKKYTYGKHIVARVEKLVAAGEKRISILSSYSA